MIIWMFPGQGSQRAGMANGLAACTELIDISKNVLDARLARICTTADNPVWPADLLQPAIYLTSVGAAKALEARGVTPDGVAGHSLGEFAAVVAARGLSFEDGLKLVAVRGKAMAKAGTQNPGGMAAVLGLDGEQIARICAEVGDVWVANHNTSAQTVVSGRDEALAVVAERCKQAGAKKVVKLDVPIAAHTPLMQPAADELAEAIERIEFRSPVSPFYSGVDAAKHEDPAEIKSLLVKAVTSPVRFVELLETTRSDGFRGYVEVGPARVLTGLIRQNLPDADTASVATDGEADALAFSNVSQTAPVAQGA